MPSCFLPHRLNLPKVSTCLSRPRNNKISDPILEISSHYWQSLTIWLDSSYYFKFIQKQSLKQGPEEGEAREEALSTRSASLNFVPQELLLPHPSIVSALSSQYLTSW